jgi:hypothetical protein
MRGLLFRRAAKSHNIKGFAAFASRNQGTDYRRFPYGLKVPFPPEQPTATLVLEQTSGEGCFDERPRNSNECWGVLFCAQM